MKHILALFLVLSLNTTYASNNAACIWHLLSKDNVKFSISNDSLLVGLHNIVPLEFFEPNPPTDILTVNKLIDFIPRLQKQMGLKLESPQAANLVHIANMKVSPQPGLTKEALYLLYQLIEATPPGSAIVFVGSNASLLVIAAEVIYSKIISTRSFHALPISRGTDINSVLKWQSLLSTKDRPIVLVDSLQQANGIEERSLFKLYVAAKNVLPAELVWAVGVPESSSGDEYLTHLENMPDAKLAGIKAKQLPDSNFYLLIDQKYWMYLFGPAYWGKRWNGGMSKNSSTHNGVPYSPDDKLAFGLQLNYEYNSSDIGAAFKNRAEWLLNARTVIQLGKKLDF